MAEQSGPVHELLDAIEAGDWGEVAEQLHVEIWWTNAVDEQLRGRDAVLTALRYDPPPAAPSYFELADGLIVRWIDCPG